MTRRDKGQRELEMFIMVIALLAMGFFIWMSIAMVFAGCGGPVIPPPGPPEPEDSGTLDDCGPACENLERLQCPGWRGSPGADETWGTADDYSCEVACRNIMYADPTATLYPICTANATTCDEVELCFDPSAQMEGGAR